MIAQNDVISEARKWLGTPFQHQGCVRGVGCDCVGLVRGVGMALKLVDYDPASPQAKRYAAYSVMPNPRRMREALGLWLLPIPLADATLADIYFMAWGREPQHVALVTDRGIIHSYARAGQVVEHRLDDVWRSRIVSAYRYPALKDGG